MHETRRWRIALVLVGLLAAGCTSGDGDSSNDPARLISEAATKMIDAPDATAFEVTVRSPRVEYEARGLVDLGGGIYRVSARASRAPLFGAFDRSERDRLSTRAVGINGRPRGAMWEDFERFEGERQTCWVSPHLPVGTWGGAISVEDTVLLLGELIERLRYVYPDPFPSNEIELVPSEGTASSYRVPEALLGSVPMGAAIEPDVWDRLDLVSDINGAVRVSVEADGRITGLVLTLRHRPLRPEGLPGAGRRLSPEKVAIRATLTAASEPLHLVQPECLGTE